MSEPKAQGQEPTMEEILASIRRIISENDEPDPSSAASAQPATPKTSGSDGVLELTDMVGADGKVVSLAAAKPAVPASDSGPPPTQELSPMVDPDFEPPAKPHLPMADDVVLSAAEPQSAPPPKQDDSASEGVIGMATAAASTAAFAALTKELHRNGSPSAPVSIGSGRTLEDLVQETIRPMLREWLDANLPAMVERMIKREIDRMARRAEEQ